MFIRMSPEKPVMQSVGNNRQLSFFVNRQFSFFVGAIEKLVIAVVCLLWMAKTMNLIGKLHFSARFSLLCLISTHIV